MVYIISSCSRTVDDEITEFLPNFNLLQFYKGRHFFSVRQFQTEYQQNEKFKCLYKRTEKTISLHRKENRRNGENNWISFHLNSPQINEMKNRENEEERR